MLSIMLVSCKESKELKVPDNSIPNKSIAETADTKTDLSVSYYKSDEIYEDITSNHVIGFYNGKMYFKDYEEKSKYGLYNVRNNSELNIPEKSYHALLNVYTYNDQIYIMSLGSEGKYYINKLSPDFSEINTHIEDDFISDFRIGKTGCIYTLSYDMTGNNFIKKYDETGKKLKSINLNTVADFPHGLHNIEEAEDGSVFFVTDNMEHIIHLDSDLSVIKHSTFEDKYNQANGSLYNTIAVNEYNMPVITLYDPESNSTGIYEYDMNTSSLKEIDALFDVEHIYNGNEEYDLFYLLNRKVYGYNSSEKTSTVLHETSNSNYYNFFEINDEIYGIKSSSTNNYVFKSNELDNNDQHTHYSIETTNMLQKTKIHSNGMICVLEQSDDNSPVHIKNIKEDTENTVVIKGKENCFITDILAINDDTTLIKWHNEEKYENFISIYNSNGEELSQIKSNENDSINDIVITPDGRIFAYVYTDEMCFKEISIKENKLLDTPVYINQDDYILECYDGNSVYDFFYSTETCVFGVNVDENICKLVLDINRSDLPYDVSIFNFYMPDDKTIYISTAQSIYKLIYDENNSSQITTITIGDLCGIDRQLIKRFEKANPTYKINVVDYISTELSTLQSRLDMALISEDTLDLIVSSGEMIYYDIARHNNKNAYVDLYTLMENDEELSSDMLIENVLKAMETDGALYQIPTDFSVSTLICKENFYGQNNADVWSVDEFNSYLEKNNNIFFDPQSTELLNYFVLKSNEFMNTQKGNVNYNNETVKKFISSMSKYNNDDIINSHNNLLTYQNIYNFNVLNFTKYDEFEGSRIYNAGIPGNSGNGAVILPRGQYSILKSSENTDSAWKFIKFMLSEEIQEELTVYAGSGGFPIRKDILEKNKQSALKGLNGAPEESYNKQGELIYYGYPDDEILNHTMDIITNADTIYNYNFYFESIISDEINSYNNGIINIDDAVKNLQSRINIYMSERY